MDTLFDFNLKQIELEAQRIAYSAVPFRETAPSEGRRILEEGLKQYPENDILLNNLLYVMNYTENPDETITVASKLIEKTTFEDVKYDALRFLANAYEAKGDLQSAEAALEQIPEIYFTKLTELAFLLSGERKREVAEKQKWISFEHLLQMMGQLVEYYDEKENLEAAVSETQKALALVSIMDNPCFDNYKQGIEEKLEQLSRKS